MSSPRSRSVGWVRGVLLLVTVLAVLTADVGRVATTFAKEIDLTGTVDCGQSSGKRCSLDDTLVLLTDQVAGELAPARIDIRWIKGSLPALDQDDEITLAVQVLPNGTLQALSIISDSSRSGTLNQGLSTGSVEIGEARNDRADRQDEDVVQSSIDPTPTPTSIGASPTTTTTTTPTTTATPTTTPTLTPGTLTGSVTNLLTGAPVAGATITVNGASTTASGSGAFSLAGLAPGTYQASASAPGFVTRILMVTITSGTTTQAAFTLATAFQDVTITVVWGSQPPDLDAHLSGPASGGGRFHAFFLNPNPESYVSLTARDDDGFGPEQIVIRRDPATGLYVPGDYHFWVHNFSNSPEFDVSQGRVVVNQDARFLGEFNVSGASGDPRRELWYVLNVQIDAAGNATVVPVQQFVDDAGQGSFQVLVAPPYGPKREPEH